MRVLRRSAGGLAVAASLLLGSCAGEPDSNTRPLVVVSVLPQKYFVERIAGDSVRAAVMIPPGASPATHEPSIEQLRGVAAAALYVKVGHPHFPFEKAWLDRVLAERVSLPVVDSTAGIDYDEEDPHLWVAPAYGRRMAEKIHDALASLLPERRAELDENLDTLLADIAELDAEIRRLLAGKRGRVFLVFHPAWSYFAEAYDLEQLALESHGKEPNPRELSRIIARARALETPVIFVQPQFDRRAAQVVAGEIGARVVAIDPLAYDWPENLRQVAAQVAEAAR